MITKDHSLATASTCSTVTGSPPVPLVPLVLDHNLRNTRQIANAFQPLVDHPMRFLGREGPAVEFVPCAREDAMDDRRNAKPPAIPRTGTASGMQSSLCSPRNRYRRRLDAGWFT